MPFNNISTRMPNGVTNAAPYQTMANYGAPDPTWSHQFVDDFDSLSTTSFTTNVVGSGTFALTAGNGGFATLTTSSGTGDSVQVQKPVGTFIMTSGEETFFKFSGILGDTINEEFYCGLIATSTTPLIASDGLYIQKAPGGNTLQLMSVVGGVTTIAAFPSNQTLTANVRFEVGFHVDALGNVEAFYNPSTGAPGNATSAQSRQGRSVALYAPGVTQALLNPSFGLLNAGTAAVHTLAVDYVVAAVTR